jgi:methionyl-tRNA formyltransferase
MNPEKIILLAGKGFSTQAVYHALSESFNIEKVIIEQPVNRKEFIKRRIKKLGLFTVAGQVLFQFIIIPVLHILSKKRRRELIEAGALAMREIPPGKCIQVPSINDERVIELLDQLRPSVVIVNGTRIISKKVLEATSAKFVNTHAGITPAYRGVHGAYWALANNDAAHCGVTVHLVDTGIDTGGILYQGIIKVTPKDNFVTYPYIQIQAGIALLKKALADLKQGRAMVIQPGGESKLWSHPTIWQYVYNRIFLGVK